MDCIFTEFRLARVGKSPLSAPSSGIGFRHTLPIDFILSVACPVRANISEDFINPSDLWPSSFSLSLFWCPLGQQQMSPVSVAHDHMTCIF